MRLRRDPVAVFINVPFDDAYDPLLEALIFTVHASGYKARCALEEDDSGDIRIDKLTRLIGESPRSIHDLSRIEVEAGDVPRFNMPFELGLAMGARRFSASRRNDRIKIMVHTKYTLPKYLSDLGGNDPDAHHGRASDVIGIVRGFLHRSPSNQILPGQTDLAETFNRFKRALPAIARRIRHRVHETHVRRNYRTFLWCVTEFLKGAE